MEATLLIGGFWAAFAGTHVWLSSARTRAALIERVGPQPFQGIYSLVALATFVPLVWIFARHKHAGPLLWMTLGPPTRVTQRPLTLSAESRISSAGNRKREPRASRRLPGS